MLPSDGEASALQVFLELQRVRLNCDVQIAHRSATHNVPNRTASKKYSDFPGPSYVGHGV